MSKKHVSLIRTIFQDPISGDTHWRGIESLLHHLCANAEPIHGAGDRVLLNDVEGVLHHPRHSYVCSKQDFKRLRQYLASARVTPALYEERHKNKS